MPEEKLQVKAVEIVEQPPAGMPPSPNPHHIEQLVNQAMSGNPLGAAEALVAAGVMSREQFESLKAEAQREQVTFATFGAQIGKNTEVIRHLGYMMEEALKNFVIRVNDYFVSFNRRLDLIERTNRKCVPGWAKTIDALEADRESREVAAEVAEKSGKSSKVTTSQPPAKSP